MRPVSELPAAVCRNLVGVFCDIDDTLTTEGRLTAGAYASLERLAAAGLAVVPITGRPAGWCDMIARFWPVAGVVGENGAFYFSYDGTARRMVRRFVADEEERRANRARLEALGRDILAAVPGAAISADQLYREADLAIDFCEDVPALPRDEVERIVALFEAAGAVAKISSIHVNGWFGHYDKLSMAKLFAADVLTLDLDREKERFVFVGDSPNDAPLFGFFPYACGVANVLDFAGRMPAEPAFVAPSRGGEGFVELADTILRRREG
jgi:HAD superfamily hydrolase (TIGR01484 family)